MFGPIAALINNVPMTSSMLVVVDRLLRDYDLRSMPVFVTLALSMGLGGNGSMFGSVSNIIAMDVAEQHGVRISFWEFFRTGFPLMINSFVVTTVFLLFCHVVL